MNVRFHKVFKQIGLVVKETDSDLEKLVVDIHLQSHLHLLWYFFFVMAQMFEFDYSNIVGSKKSKKHYKLNELNAENMHPMPELNEVK